MSVEPWSPEAFEQRYRERADPWNFECSEFEQRRYDDILAALPSPDYAHAYEPGCSVGALTVRLAARCRSLLAVDVSPTVVERARDRCRSLAQVTVDVGSVLDDSPPGLDLIVFSEIGYYFDLDLLGVIVTRLAAALEPGGELLACHWLGESADHQLHGSVVHAELARLLSVGYERAAHRTRPEYTVDVWRRS